MGYTEKAVFETKASNTDNQDLLRIFIPARREVDIFGLRAMIGTSATLDTCTVELVDVSNNVLGEVSCSGLASGQINELSFSNGPIHFVNSLTTPTMLKLRQNVAGGASVDVTVSLDIENPGTQPFLS